MKLRADLYRREAGELLRNISMYPGLSETQLSRFFPGKEESVHTLLSHMINTGRAILSAEGRFFASAEQLDRYDHFIAHAVWVASTCCVLRNGRSSFSTCKIRWVRCWLSSRH